MKKKLSGLTKFNLSGRLHARSLLWIIIAFVVVILSDILPATLLDSWYYKGMYQWFRSVYDFLLSWMPLPMIYIVLAIILVRIAMWTRKMKKGIPYQVSTALGGISFLIILFYLFWGFNYNQIPLQEKLGFDLKAVSEQEIAAEFQRASNELQKEAALLPERFVSDEAIKNLKISDNDLRPDVVKALDDLDLPHSGCVRVRQLWPNGLLLRWSTAGIYIPQTGEGHIDVGLLSIQKPFTIAHEMAHGYGVTDEGACNFIAWLACSQSRDTWVRFGGAFTYWRYAAAEMPKDSVEKVLQTFNPVVLQSLKLISENDSKYPEILPRLRDAIYSSYLKRHGVKEGLRSYNYVVLMVEQYLKKNLKKLEKGTE